VLGNSERIPRKARPIVSSNEGAPENNTNRLVIPAQAGI
jgi:hypothetical protein